MGRGLSVALGCCVGSQVCPKPLQLAASDFNPILGGIAVAHNHHIGLKVVVILSTQLLCQNQYRKSIAGPTAAFPTSQQDSV